MPEGLHIRLEFDSSACHVLAFKPNERQHQVSHRIDWNKEFADHIATLYKSVAVRRPFCSEDDTGIISILERVGQEVYRVFFSGLESLLHGETELHIHQGSSFIPFELAHDGTQFLGLRYSIDNHFSLPEMEWFPRLRGVRSDDSRIRDCLIIGGGDDTVLRSFRKGRTHPLWHVDLTTDKEDLFSCLHRREIDIMHFAGHGFANEPDPAETRLMLREPDEWSLSCRQLQDAWRQPPKLLFLNTCATAGSLDDERSGLRTLAEMFIKRGVVRLLVPLWSISDRPAAEFAGYFYDRLLADHRAPDALREARLACWHNRSGLLTALSYILFTGPRVETASTGEEGPE